MCRKNADMPVEVGTKRGALIVDGRILMPVIIADFKLAKH